MIPSHVLSKIKALNTLRGLATLIATTGASTTAPASTKALSTLWSGGSIKGFHQSLLYRSEPGLSAKKPHPIQSQVDVAVAPGLSVGISADAFPPTKAGKHHGIRVKFCPKEERLKVLFGTKIVADPHLADIINLKEIVTTHPVFKVLRFKAIFSTPPTPKPVLRSGNSDLYFSERTPGDITDAEKWEIVCEHIRRFGFPSNPMADWKRPFGKA